MNFYDNYEATRFTPNPRRRAIWAEIIGYLERRLGPPTSFLELGAGYCDAINASSAKTKFAMDIRPEVARHAAPDVNLHIGSCSDLSWLGEKRVDWVLASNLFEHLPRSVLAATLTEISQVLSQTGRLIIMQPNFRLCYAHYFDDFTHLPESIMTDISMVDFLADAGFSTTWCEPRFMPFSLKSRLPAHPLLVRAYLLFPLRPFAGQMLVVAQPKRSQS